MIKKTTAYNTAKPAIKTLSAPVLNTNKSKTSKRTAVKADTYIYCTATFGTRWILKWACLNKALQYFGLHS